MKTTCPLISLDLKKQRIRIHKQTLQQLNNPQYIQFLVNPNKRIIAIKACNHKARENHHVSYNTRECEFYSYSLLQELQLISDSINNNETYCIPGILSPGIGLALFQIDNSTLHL